MVRGSIWGIDRHEGGGIQISGKGSGHEACGGQMRDRRLGGWDRGAQ